MDQMLGIVTTCNSFPAHLIQCVSGTQHSPPAAKTFIIIQTQCLSHTDTHSHNPTWQLGLHCGLLCSHSLKPLGTAGEGLLISDIIDHRHHSRVLPLHGRGGRVRGGEGGEGRGTGAGEGREGRGEGARAGEGRGHLSAGR